MHLIDRARYSKLTRLNFTHKEIFKDLKSVKRFILTDSASRKIGEIIKTCSLNILKNRNLAIPPYDKCYIELNMKEFYYGLGYEKGVVEYHEADRKVGYLILGNKYYYCLESNNGKIAMGAAFYTKGLPFDRKLYFNNWNESDEIINTYITYFMIGDLYSEKEFPEAVKILQEWRIEHCWDMNKFDVPNTPFEIPDEHGDIRNIITILLLLNQPNIIRTEFQPTKKGTAKTKNRPYLAHNIVDILIEGQNEYKKYFGGKIRSPQRRHEVRGHFVHRHCEKHCSHNWLFVENNDPKKPKRWICNNCKGFKIWRKSFSKGNAELGYITKDYKIN